MPRKIVSSYLFPVPPRDDEAAKRAVSQVIRHMTDNIYRYLIDLPRHASIELEIQRLDAKIVGTLYVTDKGQDNKPENYDEEIPQ